MRPLTQHFERAALKIATFVGNLNYGLRATTKGRRQSFQEPCS